MIWYRHNLLLPLHVPDNFFLGHVWIVWYFFCHVTYFYSAQLISLVPLVSPLGGGKMRDRGKEVSKFFLAVVMCINFLLLVCIPDIFQNHPLPLKNLVVYSFRLSSSNVSFTITFPPPCESELGGWAKKKKKINWGSPSPGWCCLNSFSFLLFVKFIEKEVEIGSFFWVQHTVPVSFPLTQPPPLPSSQFHARLRLLRHRNWVLCIDWSAIFGREPCIKLITKLNGVKKCLA